MTTVGFELKHSIPKGADMDISYFTDASSMPEFVGTTVLDTIGLVIPNIDASILQKMNYQNYYSQYLQKIPIKIYL